MALLTESDETYDEFLENVEVQAKDTRTLESIIKRGWAESPASLLRVRVNISAQWLIGFNSWRLLKVGDKICTANLSSSCFTLQI